MPYLFAPKPPVVHLCEGFQHYAYTNRTDCLPDTIWQCSECGQVWLVKDQEFGFSGWVKISHRRAWKQLLRSKVSLAALLNVPTNNVVLTKPTKKGKVES